MRKREEEKQQAMALEKARKEKEELERQRRKAEKKERERLEREREQERRERQELARKEKVQKGGGKVEKRKGLKGSGGKSVDKEAVKDKVKGKIDTFLKKKREATTVKPIQTMIKRKEGKRMEPVVILDPIVLPEGANFIRFLDF